jgi:hypothetical protein
MGKQFCLAAIAIMFAACGNMGGNNNGGGASGGTGGGGTGGTGGGGTGGSGGGGTGGSGGGSGGTPDYVSGSRIKSRVLSSPDGAKAFAGFYDSTLAMPCSFNHAADDTLRCLPTNIAYVASYFSDSGCGTPLAYTTTGGCAPAYAQKAETGNSCVDIGYYSTAARQRIYSVAGAYGAAMVWVGSPGSCSMTATPTTLTLYNLGSEVAASTFASGSVDIAP